MHFIKYIFLGAAIISTFSVNAKRYDITAHVGQIRIFDSENTLGPAWKEAMWFGLKNPNKLPNCVKSGNEIMVTFPKANISILQVLLSAKTNNFEILVTLDDEVFYPLKGRCRLQYLLIK